MRASLSPSALSTWAWRSPSAVRMFDRLAPSATRIAERLSPSAIRIAARRLLSDAVCSSMASLTLPTGSSSLISTFVTCTPHGSVATSMMSLSSTLIFSLLKRRSSSSISPMMDLRLVCASATVAIT